jgi:hypothetical protein
VSCPFGRPSSVADPVTVAVAGRVMVSGRAGGDSRGQIDGRGWRRRPARRWQHDEAAEADRGVEQGNLGHAGERRNRRAGRSGG